MIHRSLLFTLTLLPVVLHAQAPFAKWIVQSDDPVNDFFLNRGDLIRLANGDLLQCTDRDSIGEFHKCRFVRLSPEGEPVAQWEVHAPYIDIDKVLEQADGSFACFGRMGYSALYLHLAADGTPLLAKVYDMTDMSIIAPWRWNDAVQDDADHFTLAGEWNGSDLYGMIARIHADGSLQAHDLIRVGGDQTTFFSVVRLSNGDHVFCGASNAGSFHSRTYLMRTDSLLTPQWALAYPDSGYNYTFTKLLVLPGGQFRMLLRNTDPAFIGSTLMVATTSDGTPLWAVRRVPPASYPNMTTWPQTAHLANGNIVVAGSGGSGYGAFAQILNPSNGSEVELGQLDVPRPFWGCAGDAGSSYLMGIGFGPLGSGAYSVGLTQLDPTLELCGTIYHNTTAGYWMPNSTAGWTSTTATVTITDVLADFTSYPATAYAQLICTSTGSIQNEEPHLFVAPNPATDHTTITGDGIQAVELWDATGRMILSRTMANEPKFDIDLRTLPAGLYAMRARTSGVWQALNLIKE